MGYVTSKHIDKCAILRHFMTQIAAALFAWDAVEARSDLERFFRVRDHLPEGD